MPIHFSYAEENQISGHSLQQTAAKCKPRTGVFDPAQLATCGTPGVFP
jgi:hypothetical protein